MTTTHEHEMHVLKRDGSKQPVSFDKILSRIKHLGITAGIQSINYAGLAIKVIDQLYDGIPTTKIDELTAEQCAAMAVQHPDYGILASYVIISNHHKNTQPSFVSVMTRLYNFRDKHDVNVPLISAQTWGFISTYHEHLEAFIVHKRDYNIDYFGFKTLEKSYLMRVDGRVIERPQHMWLRVAIGIHAGRNETADVLSLVKQTYDAMSEKYFTHATPTLFNAGTPKPQLSSCYLIAMENDSIDGIFDTLKDCAKISKHAGGIGLHVHNIRGTGSLIRGTNGLSNGLVPMLRVFNNTARYIDQGGRRNGSFAIYLEPWHSDIEDFLEMKKNHGDEETKGRDLFYALWIPDLFMEKVKSPNNEEWCLFCPDECKGLQDVYGAQFNALYAQYEAEGRYRRKVKARDLWLRILDSQMETGTPYLLFKDAANAKSNQKNLGTIKSSNLCVAPETHILTDRGYLEIQTLENKPDVMVWNGEEFAPTTVRKTGEDQELITVKTSDGGSLDCTPYHKFYVVHPDTKETIMKQAADLECGDVLIDAVFPVIDYNDAITAITAITANADYKIHQNEMVHSEYVTHELVSASLDTKVAWFSQYHTKEASGTRINRGTSIVIYDNNVLRAYQVKFLLQTCGVNPHYAIEKGDVSTITIYWNDLRKLHRMGATGFLDEWLSSYFDVDFEAPPVRIEAVIQTGRISDTYCFTEPRRNMGVFNGILTGQCTEIIEYSDEHETAVCNLASIALNKFVDPETKVFNYDKLHEMTKVLTDNLNRVIDVNYYPTKKTELSNKRHRPIGIGVQGLSDVFMMMDVAFYSDAAKEINVLIFETIYHAALEASHELAYKRYTDAAAANDPTLLFTADEKVKLYGTNIGAYSSFIGSPASNGVLQFDMWGVKPSSGRYDWDDLKARIMKYGIRNSLLLAPMPTASTSQILGNNECFEPISSNIYTRRTMAGEFIMVNKYLMRELIDAGVWNEQVKNNIIANKGSVQYVDNINAHIKNKYKTVWEIPMKHVIDMAADRGAYICQSQSMNLWVEDPNYNTLTSMHFYSWKKGLKTGIYYLRRKGKHQAQQFTIEPEQQKQQQQQQKQNQENNEEPCLSCSA